MFNRYLKKHVLKLSEGFPGVLLTGPRQSGKTTLVKNLFPSHTYLTFEDPEIFTLATKDPKEFLRRYSAPCILDEVQRAPDLFHALQIVMDEQNQPGAWILTGSEQILLMEKLSQTLAGRIGIAQLLPFSFAEIQRKRFYHPTEYFKKVFDPSKDFEKARGKNSELFTSIEEQIFKGSYPRLYQSSIEPLHFYTSYIQTYLERDVRDVLRIGDLSTFRTFTKILAGRSGQLLNYSSVAVEVGVSAPTIKSWISILEMSGLVYLLQPHFQNFKKRLTKMPKLYFLDTGILCSLLGLQEPYQLQSHPLRGAIFETFVVSELYKLFSHAGQVPPLYFWRDHTGHEIDVLIDMGTELIPIEIKASATAQPSFFKGLNWWKKLPGNIQEQGLAIYAGNQHYTQNQNILLPWWMV